MCVLSSSYPLPTRTTLSLSAMSSRHWIDRDAVDWLARPNAWSIVVWTVRISLCFHQKGICALLCAAAVHVVVCNAFSSFSQGLWEEKARETLRSFTSWDSSCPLRSGETICFLWVLPPFSDFLLRSLRLVSENFESESFESESFVSENFKSESFVSENFKWSGSSVNADHHFTSGRKKRIPTPRFVLTVTWVQSYSAEPFARISVLQTAYKKVIFLLSKNYKLIISKLCESL